MNEKPRNEFAGVVIATLLAGAALLIARTPTAPDSPEASDIASRQLYIPASPAQDRPRP